MTLLKRIYRLLQPEERKKAWRVAGTVFLSALLDFVGLAALLPILYYLLEGGENKRAALLFCLFAITVILVKSLSAVFFSRYQQKAPGVLMWLGVGDTPSLHNGKFLVPKEVLPTGVDGWVRLATHKW